MNRWSWLVFWSVWLFLPRGVWAGQTLNSDTGKKDLCSTVVEEDGSPSMTACQQLEVPNGSLANDGDGAFSFLGSTTDLTLHDLALSGTGPDLTFNPTSGDTWHLGAESGPGGGLLMLSNTTDGQHHSIWSGLGNWYLPLFQSCTLKTSSEGKVQCGVDNTGVGGGDAITVNSSAASDPDFANGDVDWTLGGGGTSITATVGCSGCVDATDLAADSVGASELIETEDVTFANAILAGTGPDLRFNPSGGDSFHIGAESGPGGGLLLFSDVTDSTHYLILSGNGSIYYPTLADCTLKTSAGGKLFCGTDSGGGGNSFETLDVPAGTDPVADSSTDTLTITESSPLIITGTAGTDTMAITWDAPLTVADGGTGATTLTDGGILLGSGTGAITALGVASNGQIPVGDGTTDPVLNEIDGTANQVVVTNGAGTITLSTPQDIATTSSPTFADLLLSDGTPTIELRDTGVGAADFELWADGDVFYLGDLENGRQFFYYVANNNAVYIPSLNTAACDVKASSEGKLMCGTDATGAGAGSPAGSGSELQYRVDGSTFGAVTNSSVSGAAITLAGDLALAGFAGPNLTLEPSGGDVLGLHAESGASGGTQWISNDTDGKRLLQWDGVGSTYLPQLTTCDLKTLADGKVSCATPVKEYNFPASAMEPLEAADSIPPLTKTVGTNLDEFSLSFDAATDEGRKVTFVVPTTVRSGTVTFSIYWWSIGQVGGNVVWDVRSTASGDLKDDWDQSLATDTATCALTGTTEDFNICTITETVANLGWTAGERITVMLYRDANNASDTMSGDAEVSMLRMSLPVN